MITYSNKPSSSRYSFATSSICSPSLSTLPLKIEICSSSNIPNIGSIASSISGCSSNTSCLTIGTASYGGKNFLSSSINFKSYSTILESVNETNTTSISLLLTASYYYSIYIDLISTNSQ